MWSNGWKQTNGDRNPDAIEVLLVGKLQILKDIEKGEWDPRVSVAKLMPLLTKLLSLLIPGGQARYDPRGFPMVFPSPKLKSVEG